MTIDTLPVIGVLDTEDADHIRLALSGHDVNEEDFASYVDQVIQFADAAAGRHAQVGTSDSRGQSQLLDALNAEARATWPAVIKPIDLATWRPVPYRWEPVPLHPLALRAEDELRSAIRNVAVSIAFDRLLDMEGWTPRRELLPYVAAPRYRARPDSSQYEVWLDGRRVIESSPNAEAPTNRCRVHEDARSAVGDVDHWVDACLDCLEYLEQLRMHEAALGNRTFFADQAKLQMLAADKPLIYWVGPNAVTTSPDGIDAAVPDWPKYVPTPYSAAGDAETPETHRVGVVTYADGLLDEVATAEAGVTVYSGRTVAEVTEATVAAEHERERERRINESLERMHIEAEARRRFNADLAPTIGRVLSWDELEGESQKPALVAGLLFSGETSECVAKRNIGKSLLAIALSGCVVTGREFLGRPVEPGKVLYVVSEGERGIFDRMRAWCDAHGEDFNAIRKGMRIFGAGPNLSSEATLNSLRAIIAELEPTLIIFDTWTGLSGIVKEVEQGEQARVLHEVKNLSHTAHKLILHHPNSETEDTTAPKSRGGTALPSGVDTVMTLWADHAHSDPALPGVRFLALSTEEEHAGKQKEAMRETIRGLYLAEGDGAPYVAMADRVLSIAERWVISNMEFETPASIAELQERSGKPSSTIQRYLAQASSFVVRRPSERANGVLYERIK